MSRVRVGAGGGGGGGGASPGFTLTGAQLQMNSH